MDPTNKSDLMVRFYYSKKANSVRFWDGPWRRVSSTGHTVTLEITRTRPKNISNRNGKWVSSQHHLVCDSTRAQYLWPVEKVTPDPEIQLISGGHLIERMPGFSNLIQHLKPHANVNQISIGFELRKLFREFAIVPLSVDQDNKQWLITYATIQPVTEILVPENILLKRVREVPGFGESSKDSKIAKEGIATADTMLQRALHLYTGSKVLTPEYFIHWKGHLVELENQWWPVIDFISPTSGEGEEAAQRHAAVADFETKRSLFREGTGRTLEDATLSHLLENPDRFLEIRLERIRGVAQLQTNKLVQEGVGGQAMGVGSLELAEEEYREMPALDIELDMFVSD